MEDLFQRTRTCDNSGAVEDYEYRLWAERVIKEVSEEVASEERKAHDFVKAWIRWLDLVSFLNYVEISMFRRESVEPGELQWHQTLVTGLMSLGGLIRSWSTAFNKDTLEFIGYDGKRLETAIASLKGSFEQWHTERNPARMAAIQALLPE